MRSFLQTLRACFGGYSPPKQVIKFARISRARVHVCDGWYIHRCRVNYYLVDDCTGNTLSKSSIDGFCIRHIITKEKYRVVPERILGDFLVEFFLVDDVPEWEKMEIILADFKVYDWTGGCELPE